MKRIKGLGARCVRWMNRPSSVFLESRSCREKETEHTRRAVLFLAKNPTDIIRRDRYSNRTSPAAKITCGILPRELRSRRPISENTPKGRTCYGGRRNQSRLCASDASCWNWNRARCFRTDRAAPNDIHELFILTSSSATVPYRYHRPVVAGNMPFYIPKPYARISPH